METEANRKCVWERERESKKQREREWMCEREWVCEGEWVSQSVSEWDRERKGESGRGNNESYWENKEKK